MKPLNKKERNRAFLKVVGLFLISFIIAIIVGFSTMNVAKLSEHNSNNELETLKSNLKFQENVFAPNVKKTTDLLYKIPTYEEQGENIQVINQDIGALLSSTKNQISDGDSWKSNMYKDVIKALSELQLAYNKQLELREDLGESSDMDEELQKCKNEKLQLQNQVNLLQSSISRGGGSNKAETELKSIQKKLKQCNLENKALRKEIEKYRNK